MFLSISLSLYYNDPDNPVDNRTDNSSMWCTEYRREHAELSVVQQQTRRQHAHMGHVRWPQQR